MGSNSPTIGVVTYIKNDNYGSELQAYALQNALSGLGYEARLIDYLDMNFLHNSVMQKQVMISRIKSFCRAPLVSLKLQRAKRQVQCSSSKRKVFSVFESENLDFTKNNYLDDSSFDAFVCGSDQVWSLVVPGLNPRFFLRFAPKSKRIAYAPSFGMSDVPNYNKQTLTKYLSEFSHISVREQSGSKLVKSLLGVEVPVVLDPVLLVGAPFWLSRVSAYASGGAFCYFLSNNSEASFDLMGLKCQEAEVVKVQGNTEVSGCIILSPLEFVAAIASADHVYTDSFHGAAFALLFGKKLSVYDREYETNSQQGTRIDSLFSLVGIEAERIGSRRDAICYDRETVNQQLQKSRELSLSYLSDALEEATRSND